MHTCTFFGHRAPVRPEDKLRVPATLTKVLDELLALDDAFCFYFSGAGWFDELCAREVLRQKRARPDREIRLLLVLPYRKRVENAEIYDEILIPDPLRRLRPKEVIPARNRWMVEQSQYLIAYVRSPDSVAGDMLDYARSLCANINLL